MDSFIFGRLQPPTCLRAVFLVDYSNNGRCNLSAPSQISITRLLFVSEPDLWPLSPLPWILPANNISPFSSLRMQLKHPWIANASFLTITLHNKTASQCHGPRVQKRQKVAAGASTLGLHAKTFRQAARPKSCILGPAQLLHSVRSHNKGSKRQRGEGKLIVELRGVPGRLRPHDECKASPGTWCPSSNYIQVMNTQGCGLFLTLFSLCKCLLCSSKASY